MFFFGSVTFLNVSITFRMLPFVPGANSTESYITLSNTTCNTNHYFPYVLKNVLSFCVCTITLQYYAWSVLVLLNLSLFPRQFHPIHIKDYGFCYTFNSPHLDTTLNGSTPLRREDFRQYRTHSIGPQVVYHDHSISNQKSYLRLSPIIIIIIIIIICKLTFL